MECGTIDESFATIINNDHLDFGVIYYLKCYKERKEKIRLGLI